MRASGAPPGGVREVLLTAGSPLAGHLRERGRRLLLATRNRRFRALLLAVVGVPAVVEYLYWFLVYPLTAAPHTTDFGVYMDAAGDLAAGRDPYLRFQAIAPGADPTLTPFYIYPPVVAWLLQPLVGLPPRARDLVALVVLHLCVAVFLWACCRALEVRDWQRAAVMVLLTITFFPLWQNLVLQQVNPVLLALSGLWLWGWAAASRAGSVGGGLALGAGIAMKLIQGPLALLILARRRWTMLGAVAAGALVLTALGAPGRLPGYVARVLLRVGGGTGQFLNQAPAALVTRLVHPLGFYRTLAIAGPELTVTAALLALAVLAATAAVLRRPVPGRRGRLVEAAAVIAGAPLLLTLVWDTHLLLLLPALFVLLDEAVRRGSRGLVLLSLLTWFLLGPAHGIFLANLGAALASGALAPMLEGGRLLPGLDLSLRLQAEAGAVGMVILWLALLRSYRRLPAPA